MDLKLHGKTALVTGASAGIGWAIATELAKEGVHLAIVGRRQDKLEELAANITAINSTRPTIIVQDALEEGAPQKIAAQALAGLGRIDIVVNNAGGSRPFKLHTDESVWDEALTLNFTRHRQLTDCLIDQMINGRWGRVINITGKSEPDGINGAFCAKAAMHAWAKGLSREVGKHGITVNCIPPGRIMSDQIRRNYTPEYRAWQS
jgi:3-oxoacyl-[acyl-carrier protein] reductase